MKNPVHFENAVIFKIIECAISACDVQWLCKKICATAFKFLFFGRGSKVSHAYLFHLTKLWV